MTRKICLNIKTPKTKESEYKPKVIIRADKKSPDITQKQSVVSCNYQVYTGWPNSQPVRQVKSKKQMGVSYKIKQAYKVANINMF